MRITEFATRFGIQSDVHLLLDYTQRTEPDEYGRRQRLTRTRWSVTFRCPEQVPGAERVLVLDYETGPNVAEEDVDAFEALAHAIADSRDGALTFEEYVSEHGGIRPDQTGSYTIRPYQHPVRLYAQWISAMWLYHQINDWCSSLEMRAALADVRLD
jgi:hypothetical protein